MKKHFRNDDAPALCISEWGWKYHHVGIPTKQVMPNEVYLPQFKFYVSGFNTSPFGIEWMRFEDDSPIDKLVQTVPHVAFEVEDMTAALKKCTNLRILTQPNVPCDGITVAIVEHNGAPVELIQFDRSKMKSV